MTQPWTSEVLYLLRRPPLAEDLGYRTSRALPDHSADAPVVP
jgi:hypothetical protein